MGEQRQQPDQHAVKSPRPAAQRRAGMSSQLCTKACAALWGTPEPVDPRGSCFPMSYVHAQMWVGITYNINHPHCQRHGQISLDSKSLPSRSTLSRGTCIIIGYFGTAGARFPWGSCLVTHSRLIWCFWPQHDAIGRGMSWTTSSHTFQRLFVKFHTSNRCVSIQRSR